MLHNAGGNRNHSLLISMKGVADNKSAIGAKVEVFADGVWQKFEVAGASGYLSQGAQQLLAGIGSAEHADLVRILWPTGVPQDETDMGTKNRSPYRTGSPRKLLPYSLCLERREVRVHLRCDWRRGRWALGFAHGKNNADPDEWIKVEGSQLRPRGGILSLRFGEPMEEVNYIDQVRLMAIDHPAGTEVYPNERFLNEPPFASGHPVISTAAHPVAGAWDDHGRDVSELLRTRSPIRARLYESFLCRLCQPAPLTLDLGDVDSRASAAAYCCTALSNISPPAPCMPLGRLVSQPMAPYVEAQLPDGSWKRVIDDMGFPAGLPRTIVVDLTGKLPPGTRRIRLVTNLQIYWDQALVDNGPEAPQLMRETELPLASAQLAFRGYPEQIRRQDARRPYL